MPTPSSVAHPCRRIDADLLGSDHPIDITLIGEERRRLGLSERRYALAISLPRCTARVEAHFNQRLLPLVLARSALLTAALNTEVYSMHFRRRARASFSRAVQREVSLERIATSAIAIADAEGLGAVSMRRIAVELGVATMALYRHVRGKSKLLLLMADAVMRETPLPANRPAGWRPQLELVARLQCVIYRRHAWLARVISMTRPDVLPNGMTHSEWALRAVAGLNLDPNTMLHVAVRLFGYVRGSAMNLEMEAEAEQETGMTDEEWVRFAERRVHQDLRVRQLSHTRSRGRGAAGPER